MVDSFKPDEYKAKLCLMEDAQVIEEYNTVSKALGEVFSIDAQFGEYMPRLRDELCPLRNELGLKMELIMQEQRIRLCV